MKYRLGDGAKYRLANGIIDFDNTGLFVNGTSVTIAFVTKVPHGLINDEGVIINKGSHYYRATSIIGSKDTFTIDMPLLENVIVDETSYLNEDLDVLIHFSQPITVKDDYSKTFPIYDESGVAIVDGCRFVQNADGTYSNQYAIIPSEYNTGLAFDDNYPITFVGNTLFFDWEDGDITGGTFDIYFENAYLNFRLPFFTDSDSNLDIEQVRSDLLEDEAKSVSVPDSLDMEKQMFEPFIKSGEDYIAVDTLEFKLHFRDRYDSNGKITSGWTTDETKYWNENAGTDDSDSLEDLDFCEDDVKYQKKRLSKSFIRLLFYDSNDITNQNLLAYSTIFFDAKELYSTYLHNKIYGTSNILDSTLNVQSRFNYDKSSDGFCIHLYPTTLDENNTGTIYMKVEFNHAKYGKIIPFITPQDSNGNPIPFSSSAFPKGYMENTGDGVEINMAKYLNDTFMEIKIEYNEDLGKYIYYFPWAEDNDDKKITITLYEPRVNGFSD